MLISDFQATGWNQANATFKLSSDIQLQTFDVGGNNPAANVAVTRVDAHGLVFGQKYLENLSVQVSNFSDTPRERLAIDFQINDQTVEKREVSLNSRETKVSRVHRIQFDGGRKSMRHRGRDPSDFAPDNKFYFTIRREAPGKALIVESAARGRSDSFYLQSALGLNDALPFNFVRQERRSCRSFRKSPTTALVILNDSAPVRGAVRQPEKVCRGWRPDLSFRPGRTPTPTVSMQSLRDILPATLRDAVQTKAGEGVAITDIKFDHPIFEVFRESGRLAAARVLVTCVLSRKPNANVLARYEDGSPALVEANAGKGRVLLFTSSLGPELE